MADETCTENEAREALEYLKEGFPPYPLISDRQRRLYVDLFRRYPKALVWQAIGECIRVCDARPSPNEVATRIRKLRGSRPVGRRYLTRTAQPATPIPASVHIARIRESLKSGSPAIHEKGEPDGA